MRELIEALPKTELHLHLEGTLEPELMFDLARRNGVKLPFASVDEVRAAYQFEDLQSFLDLYYQGASVLLTEQDFYDMTWSYLEKAHRDNIVHAEVFFDPQTHTARQVPFATVLAGIRRALDDAQRQFGITSRLIMCFLRHMSENDAFATLDEALPHQHQFDGVGLDSSERDNPPEKFRRVFAAARSVGLRVVAHAGEEGPADYIWQAIRTLQVERVDHGVACDQDDDLVAWLARRRMPLTVCPLSNVRLCVFEDMAQHNILALLDRGLCVTVNSDDPSYFGGYLNDNYTALWQSLHLSREQLQALVCNGFEASWLEPDIKSDWQRRVRQLCHA